MGLIDRFKKVGSRLRKPRNRVTVIPRLEKSPPLNIAMFIEPTPFTHVSGYSNRFKEALKYLAKAGDNVEILTTDDVPDAPESFLGFPINYTKGFRFPLYNQIVLSADHEGKGKEMLGRRRPDLLHVTCPGFITLAALVYARMFKLPLVFSYHTHLPHYAIQYLGWVPGIEDAAWTALRFVLNRADLTLVTSGPMRDQLAEHGVRRLEVWRKGIDTDVFNPAFKSAEMRARLTDGHPEDPLLIYVGRLGAEKNLKLIKDMLAKLPPDTRLAFVGKGPEREALEEHFAGTRTKFMGLMRGEELSAAFASADVFVMPSESETLGFVVLEAMASGVPVVAARAGGIPDLIRDGVDSYLVAPGDAGAFTEKVAALLGDPEHRAAMAAEARAEAERWDWESATAVLRNVQYAKALHNFKWRAFAGLGLPQSRSAFRALTARAGAVVGRVKQARLAQALRRRTLFRQLLARSPSLAKLLQVRVGKARGQRVLETTGKKPTEAPREELAFVRVEASASSPAAAATTNSPP